MLLAVLIHEMGHFLVARWFDIPCRGFRTGWSGAVMTFDFSHTTYSAEAAVHLGGSMLGIISSLVFRMALWERADLYLGMTVVLSCVNLLPIDGMDGGAVLRCLLSQLFLPDMTERITHVVSIVVTLLLWTAVVWIELRVTANLGLILFVLGVMLARKD